MSALEPLTGARIPTQSDGPLGGLQITNAITDLAPNTIPFFTTASARDTAFAAWVAAGHTMRNGLHCSVAGNLMRYDAGASAWRYVGVLSVATMASRPTSGLYAGLAIRPLDDPARVYVYDGTRWVQQGASASGIGSGSFPAGCYVYRQDGSAVVTTNGSGGFTISYPTAFAAAPVYAVLSPQSNLGGTDSVTAIDGQITASSIGGTAHTAGGAVVASTSIRVNYTVVGYNT